MSCAILKLKFSIKPTRFEELMVKLIDNSHFQWPIIILYYEAAENIRREFLTQKKYVRASDRTNFILMHNN